MALIKSTEIEHPWIRYIKRRIELNKNFLGFYEGSTGSGKTYSCLRIAQDLDPDFNISRVVFNAVELMQLVNSGELVKGSAMVFDEAGVGLSSKNWGSVVNKMINYMLQTFRHRNFILLMNSPFMDFVDSTTRKLFHAKFMTAGIDKNLKEVILLPYCLQWSSYKKDFYRKRLRIRDKGMVKIVSRWNIGLPSAELIEQYEKKKRIYTDQLNKSILEQIKHMDINKKMYKCEHCGHKWFTRMKNPPSRCPKCRRIYVS